VTSIKRLPLLLLFASRKTLLDVVAVPDYF